MLNKIAFEMDRIAARIVEIKLLEDGLRVEREQLTAEHSELEARFAILFAEHQRNGGLPDSWRT